LGAGESVRHRPSSAVWDCRGNDV
jgi:hypothetical protein